MKKVLPIITFDDVVEVDVTEITTPTLQLLFNLGKFHAAIDWNKNKGDREEIHTFTENPHIPTMAQFVQWCYLYNLDPKEFFNPIK